MKINNLLAYIIVAIFLTPFTVGCEKNGGEAPIDPEKPDADPRDEVDYDVDVLALRPCNQQEERMDADIMVFIDEDGCLVKRDANVEDSCVDTPYINPKRGERIIFKAEQGTFAIIDNPRAARPTRLAGCYAYRVNGKAARGTYKYNVVGRDNRVGFPECTAYVDNVCDPRIRIDPK